MKLNWLHLGMDVFGITIWNGTEYLVLLICVFFSSHLCSLKGFHTGGFISIWSSTDFFSEWKTISSYVKSINRIYKTCKPTNACADNSLLTFEVFKDWKSCLGKDIPVRGWHYWNWSTWAWREWQGKPDGSVVNCELKVRK